MLYIYIPVYYLLVFFAVSVAELNDDFVLEYTAVRIRPKGYRISIIDQGQINEVYFKVNINKPILRFRNTANEPITDWARGDFAAVIREPTNGQFVFDNINTFVEPYSTIHFRLDIVLKPLNKIKSFTKRVIVSEDSIEISQTCPSSIDASSAFTKPPSICDPSPSTVGQKHACKGQLIFYDNFETLNLTKWTREVRMPFDAENAPFVSFQSQGKNCYVADNKLHITPTLQSEEPGFDEIKIRNGSLDLADCTGAKGKPWECSRQAGYSQILPPVISAKIHTKNFFSFRYGKVEIRARLPKGDWLFPLILLEPLESYYGVRDYVSGQIRIVYSHGNEFISHSDHTTSNHMVFGGVLISDSHDLRAVTLKGPHFISSDFHKYTLEWTEDLISLGVDDNVYGHIPGDFSQLYRNVKHAKEWNKGSRMAPFDREFFLSLGVSVGGHSDFSDDCKRKPWKNRDPKAMLNFWKDRKNWRQTWEDNTSQLEVDYIKVFAL